MESINVPRPEKAPTHNPSPESLKTDLPKKVIVAVHGIGDQFQFATIQSVANRFCVAHGSPQAIPLGKFYDRIIGQPPETYLLELVLDEKTNENVGFAEIYWADIPRIPEKEGYTIEDSKKWGKTVIDRLRPHHKRGPKDLTQTDLDMAKALLEEMLETLTVLERLLLIAEKAGVFKFNLKDMLISYLGDVQLVTDFKKYREKILHRFFEVMNYVAHDNSEIYIVAHSEGTVVAFLSLLEAISNNVPSDVTEKDDTHKKALNCNWVKRVRGLMTIGSPIDKHLIVWPTLWEKFESSGHVNCPDHKIQWRNYYDYGDPVGFELDTAREWLCAYEYDKIFEFPPSHDHGFGRYPFPGKAHNDYWTDKEVFDHFIKSVVDADPIDAGTETDMCPKKGASSAADKPTNSLVKEAPPTSNQPEINPPPNKNTWRIFGNTFPYFLVFGLVFMGVYLLYKAVNEYEGIDETVRQIFRNVIGMTCLLAGLTVIAQVPRLTRVWKWRAAAFAIFALSAVGYWFIPVCQAHMRLGCFLAGRYASVPTETQATAAVIALATVIAIVVYLVGRKKARWGLRILLVLGLVALVLTVGVGLIANGAPKCPCPEELTTQTGSLQSSANVTGQPVTNKGETAEAAKRPVWPLFIATAAFLYLWWLAALIFDLVVVWHYYIRRSVAMNRLRIMHKSSQNSVPVKAGARRMVQTR